MARIDQLPKGARFIRTEVRRGKLVYVFAVHSRDDDRARTSHATEKDDTP